MPRHARIVEPESSLLLVIDLQEGYRGKLHEEERTVAAARRLLQAAPLVEVPVVVTEQYPKGVGRTRQEVEEVIPAGAARFEKITFSCLASDEIAGHIRETGRKAVVVVGIETHVCVSQTVHDLLAAGITPHVVRDAITSRFPLEDATGFAKMVGSGAVPASSESVLFEWLHDARHPAFKAAHKLVV